MKQIFQVLTCFFLLSGAIACFAQGTHGPFQVGFKNITFTDANLPDGQQTINARVFYPAPTNGENQPVATNGGLYPIVAFGHGFNMNYLDYQITLKHLTTYGFIVITPDVQNGFSVDHKTFAMQLAACIKYLKMEGQKFDSPFYLRTAETSGCFGHSMGGGATYLVPAVFPEITAVSGLAPAETNPSAIAALASIACSFQVISGSEDNTAPESSNQIPMYNAAPTLKHWVSITGGAHCKFSDASTVCDFVSNPGSITRENQVAIACKYVTAFFRKTLKNESVQTFICGDSIQTDQTANILKFQTTIPCTVCELTAYLTPEGPAYFCAGDSLTLTASASASDVTVYEWRKDGNFIPDVWGAQLTVTESGVYTAKALYSPECEATSNAVTVNVNPGPPTPNIVILGPDSLGCDLGSEGYQWYKDGVPIFGGFGPTWHVTEPGVYTVAIIDFAGCTSQPSPGVTITNRSDKISPISTRVYPNPTENFVFIDGNAPQTLTVFDAKGVQVAVLSVENGKISLEGLPAGIYALSASGFQYKILKK